MPTLTCQPDSRATVRAAKQTATGLHLCDWSDQERWDSFVMNATDGTVCHLFAWKAVIEQAYGHRTFYLAACDRSGLRGVLPLVLTRSPLFGVHLTSMPYLDYGGILSDDDEATCALLERARQIGAAEGATLNLRYKGQPGLDLPTSLKRVTMLLELGDCEADLWARLPAERRNRIRKGQKNGLEVSFHGEEGVEDFFDVFARNMRDLGSPVHGLAFFQTILRTLKERAVVLLVRDGHRTIGAAVCLLSGETISIPWVSSLRPYFRRCPNQVLYWEAMRYGIAHGCRILDFGRSARGDGTFEAKRQWGANPVQLHWVYESGVAETEDHASQQHATAIRLWQRLPVPLTKAVGPWIRKGLPS